MTATVDMAAGAVAMLVAGVVAVGVTLDLHS